MTGTASVTEMVDAVAVRLCPSHHRQGAAWSFRNSEGVVSAGHTALFAASLLILWVAARRR